MDYKITKNYDEMSKLAAQKIASVIRAKNAKGEKAVIGLATGSTPEGVYAELVRMHKEEGLSFKNVVTFNLDEYVLDKPDPDFYKKDISYHGFMQKHLFDHVDIDPNNIHVPNTMAANLAVECQEYEQKIQAAGGVDLQLVGIGENGHLGFCEPGSDPKGRTSVVKLTEDTIRVNQDKFNFAANQAISMGLGTIMDAKEILLIANGPKKAPIIERTDYITDDDPTSNPAKILHFHRNAHAILDAEAAQSLEPQIGRRIVDIGKIGMTM